MYFTVNTISVDSWQNNSRRAEQQNCACSCACVRVCLYSIYLSILSLLYLLLLDSFFNQKKYLIPFKSIIPNTSKWHSELKEVTTTNNNKKFIPAFYLIPISSHGVSQNAGRGAQNWLRKRLQQILQIINKKPGGKGKKEKRTNLCDASCEVARSLFIKKRPVR